MSKKIKKIEITWKNPKSSRPISQIYSSGLEYCFLSAKKEQCHHLVYCKDFLQDAVQGHIYNTKKQIYNFSYDPNKDPSIDMRKTRLVITNQSDADFGKKIPTCISFLNQIEKKLRLKTTIVFSCKNPPLKYEKCGVFVLQSSGIWQSAPPLLSAYSLFIRVGMCHKEGTEFETTIDKIISGKIKPYCHNDFSYLKSAKPGIDKILKFGYRKIFYIDPKRNYPARTNINTMHNRCGIVGYSGDHTATVVPYWHRKIQNKTEVKK